MTTGGPCICLSYDVEFVVLTDTSSNISVVVVVVEVPVPIPVYLSKELASVVEPVNLPAAL